jgi:hypothetical protein
MVASVCIYTCLYYLTLLHEYLPNSFMDASIVPLVKNKPGDLTDVNNYRAIAISNACSKLLEVLLLEQLHDIISDDHQLGFEHEHSTGLCPSVALFKDTVDLL